MSRVIFSSSRTISRTCQSNDFSTSFLRMGRTVQLELHWDWNDMGSESLQGSALEKNRGASESVMVEPGRGPIASRTTPFQTSGLSKPQSARAVMRLTSGRTCKYLHYNRTRQQQNRRRARGITGLNLASIFIQIGCCLYSSRLWTIHTCMLVIAPGTLLTAVPVRYQNYTSGTSRPP